MMIKFILRIVALLLVPCLIADPVFASSFHATFSPAEHQAGIEQSISCKSCCEDQALMVRLAAAFTSDQNRPIGVFIRRNIGVGMAITSVVMLAKMGQSPMPFISPSNVVFLVLIMAMIASFHILQPKPLLEAGTGWNFFSGEYDETRDEKDWFEKLINKFSENDRDKDQNPGPNVSESPSSQPETGGAYVARHRERLGWTQKRLADEIDVTAPFINKVENDSSGMMLETAIRLADKLNFPISGKEFLVNYVLVDKERKYLQRMANRRKSRSILLADPEPAAESELGAIQANLAAFKADPSRPQLDSLMDAVAIFICWLVTVPLAGSAPTKSVPRIIDHPVETPLAANPGAPIRQARKRLGREWTQARLAEKLGVGRTMVNKLEQGVEFATLEMARKLGKILPFFDGEEYYAQVAEPARQKAEQGRLRTRSTLKAISLQGAA